MNNVDLFDTPICSGKVRNGVWYHKYRNGTINIMGKQYVGYSIKDAVSIWRKNNKSK